MSIIDESGALSPKLIRNGAEVQLKEHILNLPILTITTENGAPIESKETYLNATYELRNTAQPFTQAGQIRGRGNSTWDQPKKPYKIKFTANVAPLGMVSRKDWVLLANHFDISMIRNAIAFEIGYKATGLPWTPKYRFVDVILNGTRIGVYQLVDHIEVKSNRININEIADTDTDGLAVTGGYSMEIDVRMEENNEPGFRTRLNVPITLDEPDGAVPEQFTYIKNFIQEFEDVLYSSNFADPTNGFRKYVDVNSFIDWYWVNEFMANNDSGFGASVKLYKTRDTAQTPGKLFMGPLWDFDRSVGIGATYPYHPSTAWWTRNGATWIVRMMEDPAFVTVLNQRWVSLRNSVLADNFLYNLIDTLAVKLQPQLVYDSQHWNYDRNESISRPIFLKDWLQQRVAWIDNEIVSPVDATPPTVPQNLTASSIGPYEIVLTWDESSDDGYDLGTTGYRIWQDGEIAAIVAVPYSDPLDSTKLIKLTAGTSYDFEIQARDAAGNWSAKSPVYTVSTAASSAGPNGLSLFLSDAPGAMSVYDDATPITVGTEFYVNGTYGTNRTSVGGRVYIPDDALLNGQITIGIWTDYTVVNNQITFDLAATPRESRTVTVTDKPGWVEAVWLNPVLLEPLEPIVVAYTFVDSVNKYVATSLQYDTYSPNVAVSPGLFMVGATETLPSGLGMNRGIYKYGNSPTTNASTGYYGADILLNEPV